MPEFVVLINRSFGGRRDRSEMKEMFKKEKREKGFTLLEVMIAIVILTFGILAVASMQNSSLYGNSLANRLTEGTSWAGDKMEELLTISETDGDLSKGKHGPEIAMSGANRYEVSWEVIDDVNPSDPLTSAKLITVTVTWQDKGNLKWTRVRCIRPGFF